MSQEVKFKVGPDGRLVEVKARGRPRKSSTAVMVGDGLSAKCLLRLAQDLLLVPELAKFGPAAHDQLVKQLAERMAFFPLMQPAMLAAMPKQRGNRSKLETQTLIRDCAVALEKVTGESAPIWCSPGAGSESAAVKVARVCLGVLLNAPGPFQGDLKRQAERAAKIR